MKNVKMTNAQIEEMTELLSSEHGETLTTFYGGIFLHGLKKGIAAGSIAGGLGMALAVAVIYNFSKLETLKSAKEKES